MQNNKQFWFFGSKLNTVLLAVLIVLMVIALRWMYQNKQLYTGIYQPQTTHESIVKLQDCPDEKISNQMPMAIDPNQPVDPNELPRDYYVYKEARHEIYEFDTVWVKLHCKVKETVAM